MPISIILQQARPFESVLHVRLSPCIPSVAGDTQTKPSGAQKGGNSESSERRLTLHVVKPLIDTARQYSKSVLKVALDTPPLPLLLVKPKFGHR